MKCMRWLIVSALVLSAAGCGKRTIQEPDFETWEDWIAGAEVGVGLARDLVGTFNPADEQDAQLVERITTILSTTENTIRALRHALDLLRLNQTEEWVAVIRGVEVFRPDGEPFEYEGQTFVPVRRELSPEEIQRRADKLKSLRSTLLDLVEDIRDIIRRRQDA